MSSSRDLPVSHVSGRTNKSPKQRSRRSDRSSKKTCKTTKSLDAFSCNFTKPKQSKSRDGCATCKKKRLKCDETKPTCRQCERRNVECEGYKKDYKWRTFEEMTEQSRTAHKRTKGARSALACVKEHPEKSVTASLGSLILQESPSQASQLEKSFAATEQKSNTFTPPTEATDLAYATEQLSTSLFQQPSHSNNDYGSSEGDFVDWQFVPDANRFMPQFEDPNDEASLSAKSFLSHDRQLSSSNLETLSDLLGLNDSVTRWLCKPSLEEQGLLPKVLNVNVKYTDDDLGCDRILYPVVDLSESCWTSQAASSLPFDSYSPFPGNPDGLMSKASTLGQSSQNLLMRHFDDKTCDILSIKNEPSENPWRTTILPLAQDSPALYHAILAMSASHIGAAQSPLRLTSRAHTSKSIANLTEELHKMSLYHIIATKIALMKAEGWNEGNSTGIQHLKGTESLLDHALAQRSKTWQLEGTELVDIHCLKFLSNTYIYLEAMSCLTHRDRPDDIDLNRVIQGMQNLPNNMKCDADPFMDCLATLFPLILQVASLVFKVRQSQENSLKIVSEANELKEQLLQWKPPNTPLFEQIRDSTTDMRHIFQIAESYRRAILLHLHHAVAEFSSESSLDQGKNILTSLAAIPLSSRTMVVQLFPLLVGSCEMVTAEDREWVDRRWRVMMQQLTLVNVTSCWKVVQEVWRRRDERIQLRARCRANFAVADVQSDCFIPRTFGNHITSLTSTLKNVFSLSENLQTPVNAENVPLHQRSPASGVLDSGAALHQSIQLAQNQTSTSLLDDGTEYSVRGSLHWLAVMSDWNWEEMAAYFLLRSFHWLTASHSKLDSNDVNGIACGGQDATKRRETPGTQSQCMRSI